MNPYRDSFFNSFDELFSRYGTLARTEFLDENDGSVVMWVQPTAWTKRNKHYVNWAVSMNNLELYVFSFVDGERDELACFELSDNGSYVKYDHTREISYETQPSLADHIADIFKQSFKLPKLSPKELN